MTPKTTGWGRRTAVFAGGVSPAHLLLIAMCLAACARQSGESAGAAQPKGDRAKPEMAVGPEAFEGGEQVLAAWIAYGAAKATAYLEHPPPAANESADDFAIELAAREAQVAFWSDQKKNGAPAQAMLDRQIEISRAGLLPELVIAIHGRPGWTVPAATIGKLDFDAFAKRFTGKYSAGAPVEVKPPGGKAVPDVPGADFPDPADLPMGQASCTRAIDERKAAWSRFAALEPRLGGVPVAALTPVDFARQLLAAQGEKAHRTRGVTWIAARVGYLAALDGFCAVERKDWSEATRALGRAVALRPGDAQPRLELSLALTATNRPDEALDQVTRALGLTRDGCTVGLAWRRRGYILVEKGALEAAEAAYQTSLKYDPQNRIAHKELQTIAQMRRDRGPGSSEPTVTSVPAIGMTVTECRAATKQ